MAQRRRRCDRGPEGGHLHSGFTYVVEREGVRFRVCQSHLRRGDKVFHGYGRNDYTVWTYQTN